MIRLETWSREEWELANKRNETVLLYLFTPMCGTCAVASKMMNVIDVMKPDMRIGKADLNYFGDLAIDYEIESVPCLLITIDGIVKEKVYAFQSVPDLLMKID